MKSILRPNGVIGSLCPDCGVVSNFELQGQQIILQGHFVVGNTTYPTVVYALHKCIGCGRGALSKVYNSATQIAGGVLDSFFPFYREVAPLPPDVPNDIVAEYREAELCASFGALRASSALFRSTLEKVLKANGYEQIGKKGYDTLNLQNKIDLAAQDGILTEARRKRAHDDVRSLGNDVLHDDWRMVTPEEVEAAHHYTQRIIEDFYDSRKEVEAELITKGRITAPGSPPPSSISPSSGAGS